MTLNGEVEVRFGYTLDHLDNLAHLASVRAFGRTIDDPFERVDVAWCGLVEHLYEADQRPTPRDLLRAGARAIQDWSASVQYARGYRQGGRLLDRRGTQFVKYWWQRHTPSPENTIVERRALLEIWPLLTAWQQEALVALAVHDDYMLAAEATGVSYETFRSTITRARHRFFILWHEGETPPRAWRRDQRRPAGRPYGATGTA